MDKTVWHNTIKGDNRLDHRVPGSERKRWTIRIGITKNQSRINQAGFIDDILIGEQGLSFFAGLKCKAIGERL
jgi:hypothetical protein